MRKKLIIHVDKNHPILIEGLKNLGYKNDEYYNSDLNTILDIINNYSGTDASNVSYYTAGMAYFNLNDFEKSIDFLKDFKSDDEILNALAMGVIGDSFAELNQLDDALDSYRSAANSSSNKFSSPKFLLKAGNIATLLGKKSEALNYYQKIKDDFPKSPESMLIDIQIGKNSSNWYGINIF